MVNHTQDFVAVKKYEILQYSLIPNIYNATIENLKSGHRTDCITLISLDYFVFPIVFVLKAVSGTCHSPSDTYRQLQN